MTRSFSKYSRGYELLQLSIWVLLLGYVLLSDNWNFYIPTATAILIGLFALLGLGWLLLLWRHGSHLLTSPLDAGIALFVVALLLSSIFSLDISRSVRLLWAWTACIVVFYMALTAFRSGWAIEPPVKALLVVATLLMATGYIQFYFWLRQWFDAFAGSGLWPPQLLRVWGITNSPNTLAVLLNMPLMLALTARRQGWRSPLLVFWLVAAIPMLIIVGSRSGWLGAIAGVGVLIVGGIHLRTAKLLQERAGWLRLIAYLLLAALVLAALIFWRRPGAMASLTEVSEQNRLLFWQIALESWKSNPWFGSGLNTYVSSYAPNGAAPPGVPFTTAHSIFFNTLAEMGLVGLVVLLLIFVQLGRFIWQAGRARRLDGWAYGLLASLAAFFVHILFDFPEPWVLLLALILLAAFIARVSPATSLQTRPATLLPRHLVTPSLLAAWLLLLGSGFVGWQATSAYAAGVDAAESGAWPEARAHFVRAEEMLPFDDSSSILMRGLVEGVLALEDRRYLASAIDLHRRLIEADPGWSVHYANLAALLWQEGQTAEAIRQMEQAVRLSPTVPPFLLNLALWHEAHGHTETAAALYGRLYHMEGVWRKAPFWGTTTARHSAAQHDRALTLPVSMSADAMTSAEGRDEERLSLTQLEALVGANPYDSQATLALAIAQLENGMPSAAGLSLQRAAALSGGRGSAGPIRLWQQVVADDMPAFYDALSAASRQSAHGFGFSGSTYLRMAHLRTPPSFDLLPQLTCFTVSSGLAPHLDRLRDWYVRQGRSEPVEAIDRTLAGSGDGLAPCMRVTEP